MCRVNHCVFCSTTFLIATIKRAHYQLPLLGRADEVTE
jgi:hypothetical protein